jgi:hypothetical protein
MATWWRRQLSDEDVDGILENSESESEVETESTYYNSDSDNVSDDTSSQRASSRFCDGSWKTGDFRANKRIFISTNSGYTSTVLSKLKGDTPMDFFNLFFDGKLVSTIVDHTNLYHDQTEETSLAAVKTPSWFYVTIGEIYLFLATTMLMPFTKKNKLLDYWSTDRLIMTPISTNYSHVIDTSPYYDIYTSIIIQNNQKMTNSIN